MWDTFSKDVEVNEYFESLLVRVGKEIGREYLDGDGGGCEGGSWGEENKFEEDKGAE